MEAASTLKLEYEIAERILNGLPEGIRARYRCEDAETISYVIPPQSGLRLASIVFSRRSLRALAGDPDFAVKIDYLQRDVNQAARRKSEFRFPHPHGRARKSGRGSLTLASSR